MGLVCGRKNWKSKHPSLRIPTRPTPNLWRFSIWFGVREANDAANPYQRHLWCPPDSSGSSAWPDQLLLSKNLASSPGSWKKRLVRVNSQVVLGGSVQNPVVRLKRPSSQKQVHANNYNSGISHFVCWIANAKANEEPLGFSTLSMKLLFWIVQEITVTVVGGLRIYFHCSYCSGSF